MQRERRLKFKTVDKARAAAQVSRGAWDNVESGRKVKDFTLAAIEQALGHRPGLYREMLENAEINHASDQGAERLVGGPEQDADYVSSPGSRKVAGVTNDEVLRELRDMQRRIEELSERLADG